MTAPRTFLPGDRVLYRDGDRYAVARVDLVRDRHVTGFPFDTAHRRWSRVNRRIARDFILARLPSTEDPAAIAKRLAVLANQREAKRQEANTWLHQQVRQLISQHEDA